MLYDLADYLCPAHGQPFTLTSNEACQSLLQPDGWIEFRKNRHMEEFYVTDTVIGRGADTSLISKDGVHPTGSFYVQYTPGAVGAAPVYGCAWAARFMSPGQVYHRKCRVIVYDYLGTVLSDDVVESDLLFVDHHDAITLPNGITVANVLELKWGGSEVYYYGKDEGLVGWKNLADGSFGNYLARRNAVIQTPFPHAIPRPPVQQGGSAMPESPAPVLPANPGNPLRAVVSEPAGLKVRANAGIAYDVLIKLTVGTSLDYYPATEKTVDGYPWVAVRLDSGQMGWLARTDKTGTAYLAPVATPAPAPLPSPTPTPAPNPVPPGVLIPQADYDAALAALNDAHVSVENAIARLKGMLLPATGGGF